MDCREKKNNFFALRCFLGLSFKSAHAWFPHKLAKRDFCFQELQFACPMASVTDTSLALQDIAGFGWAAPSSRSRLPMLSVGPLCIALQHLSAPVEGLRDWQDGSRSLPSSLVSHLACLAALSSLLLAPFLNCFLTDQGKGGKKDLGTWPRDAGDGSGLWSHGVLVLLSPLTGASYSLWGSHGRKKMGNLGK